MSYPLNNSCSSGTQSFVQEQFGLFTAEPDKGTQNPLSVLGLASTLPGMSSTTIQPLLALPVNQQLKPTGAGADEPIQSSVDLSRTTEESRQTPVGQGTQFTSTSRCTSFTLDPMCSASQGHRNSNGKDKSSKLMSSFSSGYPSKTENNLSREGEHETQSVTSLKGNDKTVTESSCTKYTPEIATKILLRYGLEKDDLEELLFYPEDQITPENLPLVLQDMRTKKEKKTSTSARCPEPQSITSTVGLDNTITSEGTQMCQNYDSSDINPSGETDARLCGTLTAEVVEETGRTICSDDLPTKDTDASSHCKELQLKDSGEVTFGALVPLNDRENSPTSLSSIRNSTAFPTSGPTDLLPTQASHNLQKIFDLLRLQKQTDLRFPQCFSLKDATFKHHSAPKPQSSGAAGDVVHPDPPTFVPDSSSDICLNDQKQNQQEELKVESKKNEDLEQQPEQQFHTEHYQQLKQLGQGKLTLPQIFPTFKPLPSIRPRTSAVQPVAPQTVPNPIVYAQMLQKPFSSLAEGSFFKDLPPTAMMEDYAATTPEAFPHTCSLCNKQCANIKVS